MPFRLKRARIALLSVLLSSTAIIRCQSAPTAQLAADLRADEGYNEATVAVLPFEVSALPPERGRYYADRLIDELVRDGRYRLLERSLVQRVLDEQKFQNSGLADAEQAVRIGRLLSARLVLTGIAYGRPDGADLFARLIDVETGVILRSSHRLVVDPSPVHGPAQQDVGPSDSAHANPSSDSAQIPEPVTGIVEAEDAPQAEVVDLAGIPSVNNVVVIGRIRNTGRVAIRMPSVRVGLYSASGEELDVIQCFPGNDLALQMTLPFQCASLDTRDRFSYVKLISFKPEADQSHLYVFDLSVSEHKLQKTSFSWNLRGRIHHTGKIPVKYPRVIVSFFDAQNRFIGSAQGFGDDKQLQPGGRTHFQASLWALPSGMVPARYEMIVAGLKD